MEFNPREDIKGDYNVKARGVSSLVMKEVRMQNLNQLATTLTPEDWVYLDRRDFLKERLKAHDINIDLKTEDEADKIREEQQNSIMNQLQIELTKSEIAKNKAQAMGNLTKAKQHNVEAEKEAMTPPEQAANDPRLMDAELQAAQMDTENANNAAKLDAASKMEDMRRQEERHQMELAHASEKHNIQKAVDTTKAGQEIATKGEMSKLEMKQKEESHKHGLKMKEKMANKPQPKVGIKK
jgi:hypothetical protein